MLPLVFRLNPNGSLHFDILGGPAYSLYNVRRGPTPSASLPFFGSSAQGIHIPKPRNGHTTIGIRYRF